MTTTTDLTTFEDYSNLAHGMVRAAKNEGKSLPSANKLLFLMAKSKGVDSTQALKALLPSAEEQPKSERISGLPPVNPHSADYFFQRDIKALMLDNIDAAHQLTRKITKLAIEKIKSVVLNDPESVLSIEDLVWERDIENDYICEVMERPDGCAQAINEVVEQWGDDAFKLFTAHQFTSYQSIVFETKKVAWEEAFKTFFATTLRMMDEEDDSVWASFYSEDLSAETLLENKDYQALVYKSIAQSEWY